MKVLLTGATGFVGRVLASALTKNPGVILTCAVRQSGSKAPGKIFIAGELDKKTDWSRALFGQDVVVHTAARAHVVRDEVADPLAEYRKVNVHGTLRLARQAAEAGVRRFVFVSSIKVNGEQTQPNKPFTAEDAPAPEDDFGLSKLEAEKGLQELANETGLEVVIVRPPLVYGPGAKGNFATLIKLVDKQLPLPLGTVDNMRSLVALGNLVDLILTCIVHPNAANQVFLVSDGEDISTSVLLRRVATAMDKPSRLIPVPASLLQLGATLLGKKAVAQRLLSSLQVDIGSTRERLDWVPPLSVDEGLSCCFEIHQD
ncbi:MAG: nucleoside-diphosphate-sugar epimerase [Oleiphilaceae bacterium]|jgi:nucleoside-diphosphate-sugar epimerase